MMIKALNSPNFSTKTRAYKDIKLIVIHYTGMQSKIESVKRLLSPKNKVSCHYLIDRRGQILKMVEEDKVAWHAGKSKWKNFINLNKNSIGIEIVNKGHELGYEKFTFRQINSLIKICKNLKKKYKIKNSNIVGHSDIAPLRKKDPGEKFPWKYLFKKKIGIWHNLNDLTCKKFRRVKMNNKNYLTQLKRFGYTEKYKNSMELKKIIKSFQRRFRRELINGVLDKECYMILKSLNSLN